MTTHEKRAELISAQTYILWALWWLEADDVDGVEVALARLRFARQHLTYVITDSSYK